MIDFNFLNTPIILTLVRLVISPLVLPILLVYLLPFQFFWLNILLATLFVALSLTDFFDGYLARKYNQVTNLGALLDPIADKFLIYSALIALLTIHRIYFYWVILLIGREIFIMGLRIIAAEKQLTIPVSWLGKCKTFVHIIYITVAILNPYQALGFQKAFWWNGSEFLLLCASLVISLFSAYLYYTQFIAELTDYDRLPPYRD